MSIAVVGYAFSLQLPYREKWLLVCLADYADDWGESIFPAVDTLADKAGMSEDTARRGIKHLLKVGVLELVVPATPKSAAFYRITGAPEPQVFKREHTCPAVLRRAVIHHFSARCEYCRTAGTWEFGGDAKPWVVDRIVREQRSGAYLPENVTLSCRFCFAKRKANPAPEGTRSLATVCREQGSQLATPEKEVRGRNLRPQGSQPAASGVSDCDPILCIDPCTDPSKERTGLTPARRPAAPAHERPDENVAVITRLAHDVIDILGAPCDHTEFVEALKGRCAQLHIAYNSTVIRQAIESADFQRVRVGKRPSHASTAGATAFKMASGS